MSRQEYETAVDDPECMEKILIALEFLPVAGVKKTRCYMRCDKMTACLDRVDGLGDFLELEVIASEAGVREHFDPIIGKAQNDYMIERFQTEDAITHQLEKGY